MDLPPFHHRTRLTDVAEKCQVPSNSTRAWHGLDGASLSYLVPFLQYQEAETLAMDMDDVRTLRAPPRKGEAPLLPLKILRFFD